MFPFDLFVNKKIKFKKLHPEAIIPKYHSKEAAGFDFHAFIVDELNNLGKITDQIILFPMSQAIIRTGLSVSIPKGYEIQVRPRSGLSLKKSITITNSPGTIDSDFCPPNEIKIILYNLGSAPFTVKHEDRIAQGLLNPIFRAKIIEIKDINKKDKERNRGGGFGHTGK